MLEFKDLNSRKLPGTLLDRGKMAVHGKGVSYAIQIRFVWIPSRRFMAKSNKSGSYNLIYSLKIMPGTSAILESYVRKYK